MTIGERITAIRKGKKIPQKKIADDLGVSPALINQYEKGKRNPKPEQLFKISHALGVDMYELLSDDERQLYVFGEANVIINGIGKNYKFSNLEEKLVLTFHLLNESGQNKALEQVELLTKIPEYTKKDNE